MILISPREHDLVDLGQVSRVPEEQYGADILIPGHGFFLGIQRKRFPNDFIGSLHDGRLSTDLHKLKNCGMALLLLEGRPRWAGDSLVVRGHPSEFTKQALRSILASSLYLFGVGTIWTDDTIDTKETLADLAEWAMKPNHRSLATRPGPSSNTMRLTERDIAVHFLQGFPGIGPELAGRIYDHFGRIPLSWDVGREELLEVFGLGPRKLSALEAMVPGRDDGQATIEEVGT